MTREYVLSRSFVTLLVNHGAVLTRFAMVKVAG